MKDHSIFVVVGDEDHATTVRSVLEESGIANPVRWFASGDAVLDHVFSKPFCLPLFILLDIDVPGTGPTDVLRRLREDAQSQSIPVILSAKSTDEPEIDECYALGCNLYVTKPVRYEEFIHAVRALGFVLQIVQRSAAVG